MAVGTELLLGQIVDTNSSWIGEQLAAAGIDSHFQTKVGDNWQRIADSLRLALSRSDAVIVCGGLGPTQDDITRDVIADVMGVELVRDGVIEERIRQMFAARGRAMPENNLRQAMVPEGAQTMAEQPGTAPGLVCPIRWTEPTGEVVDKVIYAVPGVPLEMRQMVTGTVLADLRRRSGTDSVISSRVVRTWGHSESGVAELLADEIERLDQQGHATIAFLASGVEGLKVRITAKGPDLQTVGQLLDTEQQRVCEVLGDTVFGFDDDNMEAVVSAALVGSGRTVAVAETISGGYMASRLSLARSAQAMLGGIVVGSAQARSALLEAAGLTSTAIEPASADEAGALAEGARALFGADIGLASVGPVAAGKPTGEIFAAISTATSTDTFAWKFPGDHERVRQFSCISLLDQLRRHLAATAGDSQPPRSTSPTFW
ncbi:MAG: CinA family nicotinamide mononucleotide deamidase-related protein [Acidimicrobiales bacterium]|nr:CinA family nicotinamide mononucleotide deamidase-related protein [Acidimicrobiales bacterium]